MLQNEVFTAGDRSQSPDAAADIVWDHPWRPIRICLKAGIGPSLARHALAAFKNKKSSEIGGLFFGTTETQGAEVCITLTNAVFVPAEGRLFNSSPNDALALSEALEKNTTPDCKLIGYFRSDIRDEASLAEQDKQFATGYFTTRNSVSLLIRPFKRGICSVGVFLWNNDRRESEFTDFAMPLFTSPSQNSFDATPRRHSAKSPESAVEPEPPAGTSELPPAGTSELPPAGGGVSVSLSHGAIPTHGGEGKSRTNALLAFLIGAIVCLCAFIIGLVGFLSHRFQSQPPQEVVSATTASDSVLKQAAPIGGLDLQVSRPAADQLDVTWKRALPPEAERGQLEIIVGGSTRRLLTLDSAQLRRGKLTYFSSNSDISFHLDVLSSKALILSEYIRVLGTDTPRLPAPGAVDKPHQRSYLAATQGGGGLLDTRTTATEKAAPTPVSKKAKNLVVPAAISDSMPPVPAYEPSAAAQQPQQPPAIKTEAKSDSSGSKPAPVVLTQTPEQHTAPSTPPVSAGGVQQGPSQNEAMSPAPAVLQVNPPQPLQQVMPDVHWIFPNGVANTTRVAVDVMVSPTGRVTSASTSARGGLLTYACVTAAKKWLFTPATRDQQRVASQYQIVFVFNARK